MNCNTPSCHLRLRPARVALLAATLLLAGTLSACGGDGNNAVPNLGGTPVTPDNTVKPELRCAP